MTTSGEPTVVLAESCQASIKDSAFWENGAWIDCGEPGVDFVDGEWYCLKHTPLPVEWGYPDEPENDQPDGPKDYPKWSPPPLPPASEDAPF